MRQQILVGLPGSSSHDRPGPARDGSRRGWANWAPTSSKSRMARLYLDVPAKGVTVDLTIETRDADHTARVFAALRD